MENASKALLIAGGILLTILMVSLLIYVWGRFSNFYNSQDTLADVEDNAKFNSQFTAYNRENVHGYELISLANKVADYNNRYSNATDAKNDLNYAPIEMTINLDKKADMFRYVLTGKDGTIRAASQNANSFFYSYNTNKMIQNEVKNNIEDIIKQATNIENHYGDASVAGKLAKSINSLILSDSQLEYNLNVRHMSEAVSKRGALADYNAIARDNQKSTYEEMVNELTSANSNIMKYYEYYQFKKGKFNCVNLQYDTVNNRVKKIEFKFTGNFE